MIALPSAAFPNRIGPRTLGFWEGALLLAASSTGLTQLGLALGALGALSIAVGAIGFLSGWVDPPGRARERVFTVLGAALLLAGFAVQMYAVGR